MPEINLESVKDFMLKDESRIKAQVLANALQNMFDQGRDVVTLLNQVHTYHPIDSFEKLLSEVCGLNMT